MNAGSRATKKAWSNKGEIMETLYVESFALRISPNPDSSISEQAK